MRTSAHSSVLKRTARAIVVSGAAFAALLTLLPVVGCGGGSKGGNSTQAAASRGAVTLSIKWPDLGTSRVIPLAAQSIKLTMVRTAPGPAVTTPTIPLLTPPPSSQLTNRITSRTINGLELGTYTITVVAYSTTDATGVPVAQATVSQEVVGGANSDLNITMDATVKTAEVFPKRYDNQCVGEARRFNVTFKDSSGTVVMVAPKAVTWTTESAQFVTINSDGVATTVAQTSGSEGTIRATYTETDPAIPVGTQGLGASDTAKLTITGAPACIAGQIGAEGRANPQNTGRYLEGIPNDGQLNWSQTLGGIVVFSSPVITRDGTVYAGSYDGLLYAFNPDGSIKWTFNTGGAIDGTPVVDVRGVVYVGCATSTTTGKMYAIRQQYVNGAPTQNGQVLWERTLNGPVYGSAAISRSGLSVYVGTSAPGNTFYKLNGEDGSIQAQRTVSGGIENKPAFSLDNQNLYFGTLDGRLIAVSAADLSVLWNLNLGSDDAVKSSSPAVNPTTGNIYIGTLNGKLFSVTSGGTVAAGFPYATGFAIYSSPAIAQDGTVYFGTLDITGLDNSNLLAVDGTTGALVWNFPISGGVTSSPSIGVDGTIYVGGYDNNIRAITPDGSEKWAFDTGGIIESSPGIDVNGRVYTTTLNRAIISLK